MTLTSCSWELIEIYQEIDSSNYEDLHEQFKSKMYSNEIYFCDDNITGLNLCLIDSNEESHIL